MPITVFQWGRIVAVCLWQTPLESAFTRKWKSKLFRLARSLDSANLRFASGHLNNKKSPNTSCPVFFYGSPCWTSFEMNVLRKLLVVEIDLCLRLFILDDFGNYLCMSVVSNAIRNLIRGNLSVHAMYFNRLKANLF